MEILNCKCGRAHRCATEAVYDGCGAIEKLPLLLKNSRGVTVVADENTYAAFKKAGGAINGGNNTVVIFPAGPILIPDEIAIQKIQDAVNSTTDTVLGIGGGTVNDLCKFIAHKNSLRYVYVATAPSMDGYASDGAALILEGMKVTLKAIPPHVIICDTKILKDAPLELIQAGIGDVLGKFSCLNDWLLANQIKGEYLCDEIYDRVCGWAEKVAENTAAILARDEAAVALLTRALIEVGVEMSYAGSSRPASGSEHHMAHFFEIHSLEHGLNHRPHGIDVGCAAYYTALLRDAVLSAKRSPNFDFEPQSFFNNVYKLLPRAAEGVIELQKKTALHGNSVGNYSVDAISRVLSIAPSAEKMRGMLEAAGLYPESLVEFYGKDTVVNALKYGKELKDRFTVLWLYEYLGWEIMEI